MKTFKKKFIVAQIKKVVKSCNHKKDYISFVKENTNENKTN